MASNAFKITAYDDAFNRRLTGGDTFLGGSSGSNSRFVESGAGSGFELYNEGGDPLVQAHGNFGATETIDPSDGNVHTGTLDADTTVTLAATSGTAGTLLLWLTQDATGGRDITWAGTVSEIGTPDTTANTTNLAVATTADNGATWVVAWIGGGGSAGTFAALGWFNVEDYGAVHDCASLSDAHVAAATDDTDAINDALTAAVAAGGGTIYFPPGIYAIKGALLNTSTHNSQIVIPTCASQVAIRFLGYAPNRVFGGDGTIRGAETVLRSDWNGTISGNPAIISSGTHHAIGESIVYVTIQDMTICAHDDPKLSAIDLSSGQSGRLQNVQLRTTSPIPSAVPTHSNAVGYEGPWGLSSIVPDYAIGVDIYGYYTGLVPQEQFHGVDVGIALCARAILFVGGPNSPTYTHYPVTFTKLVTTLCVRGMVFTTDVRWVQASMWSIEHDTGVWTPVYDIDDASNLAYGVLNYQVVDYVGGVGASYDILMNGGTNLSLVNPSLKRWKLNNVVEIPTGTDPSSNPSTGFRLYAASATGKPTTRSSAGTVTTIMREGDAAGGDLAGTYPNPSVTDDSHNHTGATISGITVSSAHILLADGHASPFTFNDLLQMDDGSDFMWNDPE